MDDAKMERDEYIRLMCKIGRTYQSIADKCSLSKERIRQICNSQSKVFFCESCGKQLIGQHRRWCNKKCAYNVRRHGSDKRRKDVLRLYFQGKTRKEIAEMLGLESKDIHIYIRKWDYHKSEYLLPDGKPESAWM